MVERLKELIRNGELWKVCGNPLDKHIYEVRRELEYVKTRRPIKRIRVIKAIWGEWFVVRGNEFVDGPYQTRKEAMDSKNARLRRYIEKQVGL